MTSATLCYSFESCVVDKAKREIRRDGVAQFTTPRVFDLIVYLIEHRERVVPKSELVDRLWAGAFLSVTVIANTVMKARQVIGDHDGKFIKTIHRVGYRFVGDSALHEESGVGPMDNFAIRRPMVSPGEPPPPRRLRLALLPFENLTGNHRFSWLELGLLTVVNQALETDPRLSVSSVTTVLKALEQAPAGAAFEQIAPLVTGLIGVDWVGLAQVGASDSGFRLDYRLMGAGSSAFDGCLRGDELTALGEQLANAIDGHLFSIDAAPVVLQSDDPLANQLFARAAQAFQQGRFESALNLIRVVMDLIPDQTSVRLEHLRILEKLMSDEVFSLGERLLKDALDAGDERLAACVHSILANAYAATTGNSPDTQTHLTEALRLVGPYRMDEWTADIYSDCALLASTYGDYGKARALFNRTLLSSQQSGNRVRQQLTAYRLAGLEAIDGNLVAARDIWKQLLGDRDLGVHQLGRAVGLHMNLASVAAEMGRFDEALLHCAEAMQMLPRAPNRTLWPVHLTGLCIRYADAGQLHSIDHALALSSADFAAARGRQLACAKVAQSQRCVCVGDFDHAIELLCSGLDLALEVNQLWDAAQWAPLLIHTMMLAGRFDEAAERADTLVDVQALMNCADLAGIRLHARALACHQRGDGARAIDLLNTAIPLMRPGRWSALVRLDVGWLEIERDEIAAARQALAETFSWLKEHPIGMTVEARLRFADGNYQAACDTQQLALAKKPSLSPNVSSFLQAYFSASTGKVMEISPAQRLPSLM